MNVLAEFKKVTTFIFDIDGVFDAALAAKIKLNLRTAHGDMPIAKCGQTEGVVLLGVLLVPDSDKGRLQQANDRREDFAARQLPCLEITCDAAANPWQSLTKGGHSVILRFIACFSPLRMIAVLLSPTRIASDRLKMAFL